MGIHFRQLMNRLSRTAFAVCALQGCGGATANEDAGSAALNNVPPLPATISIAKGATADVPSANLRIRFDSVTAESRCPTDVQCIQAGSVTVALTITNLSGVMSAQLLSLSTISGKDSSTGYGQPIRLVSVSPAPVSTAQTPQSAYRIELKVGADK